MKALIDSSIIIDHLRSYQQGKDTRFMIIYKKCEAIYFSLITIAEICSGISAVKMEKQIDDIFSLGNIIELNAPIMKKAGGIRRETKISLIDAIISVCALELNLPVATLNLQDFEKVPKLKLVAQNM